MGSYETFKVEELGNNRVAIKSIHGKYLHANNGGENSPVILSNNNQWLEKTFTVRHYQGGKIDLKAALSGRYLSARDSGKFVQYKMNSGNWEKLQLQCTGIMVFN